jgi:hypothetical protein
MEMLALPPRSERSEMIHAALQLRPQHLRSKREASELPWETSTRELPASKAVPHER